MLEFIREAVKGNSCDTGLDAFIEGLKGTLSWGNRRLYLWKIWGGFGLPRVIQNSERETKRVNLYLLSRNILEKRVFWLQEPRWGDREEVRALLHVFYGKLDEADQREVGRLLVLQGLRF